MIGQKLELLLDEGIATLIEMRTYYARQNGNVIALPAPKPQSEPQSEPSVPAAPAAPPVEAPAEPVKAKRGRKPKEPAAGAVAAANPFAPAAATVPPSKEEPAAAAPEPMLSPEAANTRCLEVMGAFIRRHMKSTPSGLEQAKALCNNTCGRIVAQVGELTYEDDLKLIPVFEAELAK